MCVCWVREHFSDLKYIFLTACKNVAVKPNLLLSNSYHGRYKASVCLSWGVLEVHLFYGRDKVSVCLLACFTHPSAPVGTVPCC